MANKNTQVEISIPGSPVQVANENSLQPVDNAQTPVDQAQVKEKNKGNDEACTCMQWIENIEARLQKFWSKHQRIIRIVVCCLLVILYHAYFICALVHSFRKATALLVFTVIAWLSVFYYKVYIPHLSKKVNEKLFMPVSSVVGKMWQYKVTKGIVYGSISLAILIFIIIDTNGNRYRLISLAGLAVFVLISFMFSTHPAKINWRPVLWGLFLQFLLGLLVLRWSPGVSAFAWLSSQIVTFLDYTKAGTEFVYGFVAKPPNICGMSPVLFFTSLQIAIFFGSVISVLYYYGILQWIVSRLAEVLQCTIGTTAAESLYTAASIFLGNTEAALLIRPYMAKMTTSELHQVMTAGLATIAGSLFAVYVSFGACPSYLLSASVMSCPASFVAAKLLLPETEVSQTKLVSDLQLEKGKEQSVLEAVSSGASTVIKIVLTIAANLIVFLAFMAFFNSVAMWLGTMVGIEGLTLQLMYSYLFFPLAFLMGSSDHPDWSQRMNDTMVVAELIGYKTILNEFVAYGKMSDYILAGRISGRAQLIATYALCGFSNFGSVGIQLGCYSVMCPEKKHVFPQIAIRSLVAGSIACFITACFAGLLVSDATTCQPAMLSQNCFNISSA